jgi:hypothetical protein
MTNVRTGVVLSTLGVLLLTVSPSAADDRSRSVERFERVATFVVCDNTSCDRNMIPLTAAEIVAASEDGEILVYTDSPNGSIGFVDITKPSEPHGLGALKLVGDLAGEPTSVAVAGKWALVAVNTSANFVQTSGYLGVFDLARCARDPSMCSPNTVIQLGGQPDSVAVSSDRRFAAIVIENERDEDVNDGNLPQAPSGTLQVLSLHGDPKDWTLRSVDLTGLAGLEPGDPEPEYVSINRSNIAVVTLQENNHIVLVHLPTARVIKDFPAGTVDLQNVDTDNDELLDPVGSLTDVPREPDAIAWLDDKLFVTANEGDLNGGSRGFSIFTDRGRLVFDSGVELEYLALAHGHYPDGRADNAGVEPEGVAVARYGNDTLIFVGAERANFVAVYEHDRFKRPLFLQLLPTGIAPEGLLPIPQRDLFVVAAEDDEVLRSTITIFKRRHGKASYPGIVSELRQTGPLAGKAPIGWVALSALAADRKDKNRLYTAHDAFLQQPRLYVVDVSDQPARITDEIVLRKGGATVSYDIEGVVQRADGSFWVVSEGAGNAPNATSVNLLVKVLANGTVPADGEIPLPADVAALQRSNGFEGVTVIGAGDDEQVYVAFQREWAGDPAGQVRIGRFTPSPSPGEWRFFYYPLDALEAAPPDSFVGLSEIVALDDTTLLVLERDNLSGPDARVKRLYTVSIAGVTPQLQGQEFPLLRKVLVRDLLPDLAAPRGWVQEKVEGVTLAADGDVYIVTDNDGVDENTGETQFIRLGNRRRFGF